MVGTLNLNPYSVVSNYIRRRGQVKTYKNADVVEAKNMAFELFEKNYPEWTNTLFDKTFLNGAAAHLFTKNSLPTPVELATEWRNQFGFGSAEKREKDIDKILPVVADFLDIVFLELKYC